MLEDPISTSRPAALLLRLGELDVRDACEDAARSLASEAESRQVRLTLAFSGLLLAAGDPGALASVLRGLLAAAIEDHAGRAVLFSGRLHGGRVRVGLLGAGPAPSPSALAVEAREAAGIIERHGGMVEDRTDRPDASVVLRLMPARPRPCDDGREGRP